MSKGKSWRTEMKMRSVAVAYCDGKRCYDKKGAITAKNARFKQDHIELRVYPCPRCAQWHLTHQVRRRDMV